MELFTDGFNAGDLARLNRTFEEISQQVTRRIAMLERLRAGLVIEIESEMVHQDGHIEYRVKMRDPRLRVTSYPTGEVVWTADV